LRNPRSQTRIKYVLQGRSASSGTLALAMEYSPIPVVVIEGFLGGARAFLWGTFKFEHDLNHDLKGERRRVIFTRCVRAFFFC
jgi:hypothetical protein